MNAQKKHLVLMCAIAFIAGLAIMLIASHSGERVAYAIQEMQ